MNRHVDTIELPIHFDLFQQTNDNPFQIKRQNFLFHAQIEINQRT